MRTFSEGGSWTAEFENIDELVEFTSAPCPDGHSHKISREHSYGRDPFFGCATWDEAVHLARNGWKKGEDRARQYAARLFAKVASQLEQPRFNYDVEGLDFDVARVVMGEPECWLHQYPDITPAPGRVITVVYNCGKSAGVSSEIVLARGAVVAALVMLLEHAGYPVELIARADTSNWGSNLWIHQIVKVKRAGQPLNLPEVAFTLAHAAMHRRFFFSVREHAPMKWWKAFVEDGSYGRSNSTPEKARGDIYMAEMFGYEADWSSPEAAEAWILRELKAQGIEVSK